MIVMQNKTVVGVDLGATKVRAGRVHTGRLLAESYRKISAKAEDPIVVMREVIASIHDVMDSSVKSIGMGVPSVVDVQSGIVFDVQNIPAWKEVYLKAALEEEFQLPVFINNDANCFALGEHRYGQGHPFEHMVGLIIGTGIAGGIIIRGELYSGHNCGAGEFGMMPYLDHHYEYYCSGQFFEHVHHTSGEELVERAMKHDTIALEIFNTYGMHLGNAISAILYAVDPACIILGGSVSKSFVFFEHALKAQLREFVYPKSINRLHILVSQNPDIPVLGAAALCV